MMNIDTNMVRAGVVNHLSQWLFSGYNEIQESRRKNVLINYERLLSLFGAGSYDQLRRSHEGSTLETVRRIERTSGQTVSLWATTPLL